MIVRMIDCRPCFSKWAVLRASGLVAAFVLVGGAALYRAAAETTAENGDSLPTEARADWRQFRGNHTTGSAADDRPATAKGTEPRGTQELGHSERKGTSEPSIAWRAELPGRGVSSPIVVDGRVIVTASSGFRQDRLHVLCFDASSGEKRWERQLWATGRTLCHPTMAVAANTPASDGHRIVAFYSSNDLLCLDLAGNLLWLRGLSYDYPTAANDVGMASSPVIAGDTVIVQVENKGDSFATGLDLANGLTRWRHEREHAMNWTSPALFGQGDQTAVLLQSPGKLTAYRPRDGAQLWQHQAGCSVIPSIVAGDELLFLPSDGLTALRAPVEGSTPEVVWREAKLAPGNASPVVADGRLYTINNAGVLSCAEPASGTLLWRLRLTGTFWATPAISAGHLAAVNDKGLFQLVRLAKRGELAGQLDLEEPVLGSPAVSADAVYLRSDRHLWRLAR
jgi:outer membrane protein assembly factor BamB